MAVNTPKWRVGVGISAILLLIAALAVLVASLSSTIGRWPVLVQALFYLLMGMIWVAPMKPLLSWMETGRFRRG